MRFNGKLLGASCEEQLIVDTDMHVSANMWSYSSYKQYHLSRNFYGELTSQFTQKILYWYGYVDDTYVLLEQKDILNSF